jgi:hypothetical protein
MLHHHAIDAGMVVSSATVAGQFGGWGGDDEDVLVLHEHPAYDDTTGHNFSVGRGSIWLPSAG